jgi:hypothetical protein
MKIHIQRSPGLPPAARETDDQNPLVLAGWLLVFVVATLESRLCRQKRSNSDFNNVLTKKMKT